jgi:hypothetical protein
MTINTTTLEANLTTKINATSGSTDGKEFLLLGKAVEAINTAVSNSSLSKTNNLSDLPNAATARTNLGVVASTGGTFTGDVDFGANKITYANVYSQLSDLPAAATYHGMFAHVHATGKGYYAHAGAWIPLVNEDTSGNVTIGGNLTVSGTTTTVNSTTLDVADKNITVAKGAADAAAANGAGISVDGASATLTYASATDNWNFNKGLAVNGALKTNEIIEKATLDTTTTGTLTVDSTIQSVVFLTADQTANRTINFSNVSANLAVGESTSFAILSRQGGTAYYFNAYQVDGSTATPKWQGGSAPTSGNTQGVDLYTFTLIRTSSAIEVFATVAKFA